MGIISNANMYNSKQEKRQESYLTFVVVMQGVESSKVEWSTHLPRHAMVAGSNLVFIKRETFLDLKRNCESILIMHADKYSGFVDDLLFDCFDEIT